MLALCFNLLSFKKNTSYSSTVGSLRSLVALTLFFIYFNGTIFESHLSSFGTLNTNSDTGTGGTVFLAGNHLFGSDVDELSSVFCCIYL